MPFIPNTPESQLSRSDSRDPLTTCRGICGNGRHCRRSVRPESPLQRSSGLAILDLNDAALYCWQHKEQAVIHSARSSPGPRARPILEPRTSLDTLADRLGLDIESHPPKHVSTRRGNRQKTAESTKLSAKARKKPKKYTIFLCCKIPIRRADSSKPLRPQARPVQTVPTTPAVSRLPPLMQRPPATPTSPRTGSKFPGQPVPQARRRLPPISSDCDMPTAALLMTELARPYLASEEPGYIYMFWMMPSTKTNPPVETVKSLLAPPSPSPRRPGARKSNELIAALADSSSKTYLGDDGTRTPTKKTMLLKIGRATNVQRRMNQWSRQCSYDVEVLRCYPYVSSASHSSDSAPRMTPHCHRIERLVHIELAGKGMRASQDLCATCGREHREWFEVEANRDGIRRVDEIIRKWIEWDERESTEYG